MLRIRLRYRTLKLRALCWVFRRLRVRGAIGFPCSVSKLP
jgi:hypothetical protein